MKMKKSQGKGIYLLPNLFTTANLFSGFYAIVSAFNGNFIFASIAILVATIFDSLDGKVARMTRSSSKFGLQYDSLADLISFGVAPALLIYTWALSPYGRLGWIAAFLFVACGALRLARFNIQAETIQSKNFLGLPIPAAASVVATTVLLDYHIIGMGKEIRPIVILLITYTLAYLMVSNIRYRSLKEFNLRGKKSFSFLVAIVLIMIVLATNPQLMFFLIFSLYALSGPAEKFLLPLLRRPSEGKEEVRENLEKNP